MSVEHPTHLPSFAQAFSASSLDRISTGNSLPPIHSRPEPRRVDSPPSRAASRPKDDHPPRLAGRKRSHEGSDPEPQVKQEPEQDMLDPSPPREISDTSGAPPPSSVHPLKKRRVTISGGPPQPGALNTDVKVAPDPTNSTPISPVVIGFTVHNPSAVEQVRSMLSVKQKQKALIEQRRGSVTSTNPEPPKPAPTTRPVRRSPNAGTSSRRGTNAAQTRPSSPTPATVPPQQSPAVPNQAPQGTSAHTLPPPSISFARRRANQLGSGKKKPADILISPREEQTKEQLAPSVQSAPPIPRAAQNSFLSGRFPMTLPRLPSVLGSGENTKRVQAVNVPPTPTRMAALRNSGQLTTQPIPGIAGRSPPTASVAISSTLVPPTPSSLKHPGYSGDKSAFLAPFEIFYDALNDSKQMKGWLGEQLQRSNALIQTLAQQQDKLNEIVDGLVEKKVAGMRQEMGGLYRRIEELEDGLRNSSAGNGRRPSAEGKFKGKQPTRNGITFQDSYTFPPVADRERFRPDTERRISSPGPAWREPREGEEGSPSLEARRLSVSASRLDPPRTRQPSEDSRAAFNSPPVSFRETPHSLQPPVKLMRVGTHRSPRISAIAMSPERASTATPPRKQVDSRPNSRAASPQHE